MDKSETGEWASQSHEAGLFRAAHKRGGRNEYLARKSVIVTERHLTTLVSTRSIDSEIQGRSGRSV